jgi:spore coat polysaccharide biosynthesis predicted glycosyltransferase SpsG
MKQVMLDSDIAISAGGQTLYELARVGVPTIAVAVADNQLENVRKLGKVGFTQSLGGWKEESLLRELAVKVEILKNLKVRKSIYSLGRKLVDGRGSLRIINHLMKGICYEEKL